MSRSWWFFTTSIYRHYSHTCFSPFRWFLLIDLNALRGNLSKFLSSKSPNLSSVARDSYSSVINWYIRGKRMINWCFLIAHVTLTVARVYLNEHTLINVTFIKQSFHHPADTLSIISPVNVANKAYKISPQLLSWCIFSAQKQIIIWLIQA